MASSGVLLLLAHTLEPGRKPSLHISPMGVCWQARRKAPLQHPVPYLFLYVH
jgi:hypothetical protein